MNNDASIAGSRITPENAAAVMELKRLADAMSNAVDAKDWELVRSFTTDEIVTSLGLEAPELMPVDNLVDLFRTNLDAEDMSSHHMRSNHRVFFHDSDHATMFSTGVVISVKSPGGEHEAEGGKLLNESWLRYEHGFLKTESGWKVTKIVATGVGARSTSLAG